MRARKTIAPLICLLFGIFPAVVAGQKIESGSSAGAAGVLERLDKNKDGYLDASEMPPGLARRVGQFDGDGNGKLDATELGPVADRMNRSGGGQGGGSSSPRSGEINTKPATGERYVDSLKIGDRAPEFTLPLASGKGEISLSDFRGKKPVVLVFGSLTCPPFRSRMLQFDPIYLKHKDKVEFLMVYTREAHPESVIYIRKEGEEVLEKIVQTDDMEKRMEYAQVCGPTLHFTFPTVVDREDNRVNRAYAGWPSRFLVVDREGKIAYDGGPGPGGFQPDALDRWLGDNL